MPFLACATSLLKRGTSLKWFTKYFWTVENELNMELFDRILRKVCHCIAPPTCGGTGKSGEMNGKELLPPDFPNLMAHV